MFQSYENDIMRLNGKVPAADDEARRPNTDRREQDRMNHYKNLRNKESQDDMRPIKVFVPLRSRSRSNKRSEGSRSRSAKRGRRDGEVLDHPRNTGGAGSVGSRRSTSEAIPQIMEQRGRP